MYFDYFVVFNYTSNIENYSPVVHIQKIDENEKQTMHLLDSDLYDIIPALEFILHLPRHYFDILDVDENYMNSEYDTPHRIHIVPLCALKEYLLISQIKPTMVVYSDLIDASVLNSMLEEYSILLGVYSVYGLKNADLKNMWKSIQSKEIPRNMQGLKKLKNIECQYLLQDKFLVSLPGVFSSRQWNDIENYFMKVYNCDNIENTAATLQFIYKTRLNTLLNLGKKSINKSNFENEYKEEYEKQKRIFNLNVIVTFPGVAKEQTKYGLSSCFLTDNEKRVIRFIGVHRAISRNGILLELSPVSRNLFTKLAELERNCKNGTNNKNVWKLLSDIGKLVREQLSDDQLQYIEHAKDITVFSDFPLGLAILDDSEVPIQLYKPISYRPLTPLTRQLTIESNKTSEYYLGKGKKLKIAYAECIPKDDENKFVYLYSNLVYQTISENSSADTDIKYCYADTVKKLKQFITENRDADILYISAHGMYDSRSNVAGIMVCNEFWRGDDDISVPPVVILSACHTSPRGIGAVNIADMFIRNGAITVLGTFIPVSAKRNMILMTRLFTYIFEAQRGSAQYKTLSELWCGITANNAIHEIMGESKSFEKWMHEKNSAGIERIIDFQLNRSVNKMRARFVYSDTISIIKEMLEEEGIPNKFSNILNNENYFPESVFYQFIGSPENIFLYNEVFNNYYKSGE